MEINRDVLDGLLPDDEGDECIWEVKIPPCPDCGERIVKFVSLIHDGMQTSFTECESGHRWGTTAEDR